MAPPLPQERTQEWPYGWASIACACLAVLVPLAGRMLASLGVAHLSLHHLSSLCVKAGPPLWLCGLVLGIVAVIRGDRRRGIAGLVICGVEFVLAAIVIGVILQFAFGGMGVG
jgi:hypothetical protein